MKRFSAFQKRFFLPEIDSWKSKLKKLNSFVAAGNYFMKTKQNRKLINEHVFGFAWNRNTCFECICLPSEHRLRIYVNMSRQSSNIWDAVAIVSASGGISRCVSSANICMIKHYYAYDALNCWSCLDFLLNLKGLEFYLICVSVPH